MPQYLILDVESCKLSKLAYPGSRKVFAALDSEYNANSNANIEEPSTYKSEDKHLCPGRSFSIPWSNQIKSITLQLFCLNTTGGVISIGSCVWEPSHLLRIESILINALQSNGSDSDSVDITLNVMRGSARIGKFKGRSSIIIINNGDADNNINNGEKNNKSSKHHNVFNSGEGNVNLVGQEPLPDFQFKPLDHRINWDRIHHLNIEKIMLVGSSMDDGVDKINIIKTLMACETDVTLGDISRGQFEAEEAEAPNSNPFLNACQLAQLSAQYLQG